MINIEKDIQGTGERLIISSNDSYGINLNGKYKLANNIKKENKLVNRFKNSILGSDIGIKSEGFSTVAILSTLVAVGTVCVMYLFFKI